MVVEESRILEVSIFNTLQNNLPTVDFSQVLPDIMTIADEVDSQLMQAMHSWGSVIVSIIGQRRFIPFPRP